MKRRPPGLSTRPASRTISVALTKWCRLKATHAQSKMPSRSGMHSAVAATRP